MLCVCESLFYYFVTDGVDVKGTAFIFYRIYMILASSSDVVNWISRSRVQVNSANERQNRGVTPFIT